MRNFFQSKLESTQPTPIHPNMSTEQMRANRRKAAELILRDATAIQLSDSETWNEVLSYRLTTDFGRYMVEYAERWARLMQVEADEHGEAIIQVIAKESAQDADWDEVTPYMFKCAAQLLIETWTYGDHLKRWYLAAH